MKTNCEHKRVKKNYSFGRKSRADKKCKTCGMVITNKMISDRKGRRRS